MYKERYKRRSTRSPKMTTASYKISDRLYINSFDIPKTNAQAKPVELASNHILVIDCSGSMSGELPRIREQLKKKLPKMLKEKDTVSIVWFSGKGEFGTLIEAEPVATLADLKAVNTAIDRWLKPVGLTGFKEPLVEVAALTTRVSAKYPANGFSLFFMSDGCDNQWNRDDILKAVDKAAGGLAAAAFVEYGYYADRPLLTAMAERAGGSLLFSGDFDKYEANLTDVLARRVVGGKRIEVTLPNTDFVGGIAYALNDGDITTYAIDGGKVQVSEGTDKVWFLSPVSVAAEEINNIGSDPLAQLGDKAAGTKTEEEFGPSTSATYAAVSLFATRMKPEIVKPLLKATGDVALIESYTNCFGKQAYSTFMEVAKQAAFGKGRWTKGWDPNKVPRDDAFTVLDMLKLLASDDENRVLMAHPSFKYSKIGRSRVDSNTVLTDDEQAEIDALTAQLSGLKDPKEAAKISAKISAIADKPEALKFVEDAAEAAAGYSVSNLVYNSDRPNVSLQVRKSGTVSLASRKDKPTSVPMEFATFIFRNYTVIKDGLVNVEVLPVKLSKSTVDALLKLHKDGLIPDNVISGAKGKLVAEGGLELTEAILNFAALPVVNGHMVKSVSAKALFEAEYAMTKAKAAQKVYNAFKKEKQPEGKKSEGFETQYGADAATWLKAQGFTDYSGFNPKSVQAESTDFYMAKELSVSLKGLSSLPTLKEVQKKLADKGKLTASQSLMAPYVSEVEKYLSTNLSTNKVKGDAADKAFITWIETKAKEQTAEVRKAMFGMAQTKFAVIVGQVWFSEWKSLDENSMTIKVDGQEIEATVELKESKQTI